MWKYMQNICIQIWTNVLCHVCVNIYVCVCVCVCVCVHVYVVYEDTNLYNNMGMT